MANINNIKIGNNDPKKIMFANYQVNIEDYRHNFKDWEINKEAGHVVEVTHDKIIIKKFKPNVWIIRSKVIKGNANTEICKFCAGTTLDFSGVKNVVSNFYYAKFAENNHGAGNDIPKFYGLCIYPMDKNGTFMQQMMYTWENCWDSPSTRNLPSVADYSEFRLDGNSHGMYGLKSDYTDKVVFPKNLYDFPSNYRGQTKDWYYGIALCTGDYEDFSDSSWHINSGTTIQKNKAVITKRIAIGTGGNNINKWCTVASNNIRVKGMKPGDRLEVGTCDAVINQHSRSILNDGDWPITLTGSGSQGFSFKLYGNTSETSPVTIEFLNNGFEQPNEFIDITDNPIIISQKNAKGVDISSQECWDAYLGDTHIYHKDKTLINCWREYGFAFPEGYSTYLHNFAKQDNISVIAPNKFKIHKVINGAYEFIHQSVNYNVNRVTIDYRKVVINAYNIPAGVNVIARRAFENINTIEDENILLDNGENVLPATKKTLIREDSRSPIRCCELCFIISSDKEINNANIIIEIVPQYIDIIESNNYAERDIINLTPIINTYNFTPSCQLPAITDLEERLDYIRFSCWPISNNGVFDRIKSWYSTHTMIDFYIGNKFADAGIDSINVKLKNTPLNYGEYNFGESQIKEITFDLTNGSDTHISSPQRLLQSAKKLEKVNIKWYNNNPTFLCGANSLVDGFSYLQNLKKLPDRFFKWNSYRANAATNTIPCTLLHYAFHDSALTEIPAYPGTEDENTIIANYTIEKAFYNCKDLVRIGPILDFILVDPKKSNNVFVGCNSLVNVKIKNLNHGDWYLDGVTRHGICHGNFENIDPNDAEYFLDNLADLTKYNPEAHNDSINKTFKNWTTDYIDFIYDWDDNDYGFYNTISEFGFRKRNSTKPGQLNIPVIRTNKLFNEMTIIVSGLKTGDTLAWTDGRMIYQTITTNGEHTITKNNSTTIGFSLSNSVNPSIRSIVSVKIKNSLDFRVPKVNTANIYLPEVWDNHLYSDKVQAGMAKGWKFYVGGKYYT